MKTRKFAVSGILTIYIALSTLFMTGCEQPTNSPAPTLTGITAVYNGTAAIYPTTPLNNLKTDLTVTAAYSDGTTQTVTDYVLSGTLVVGASVVTVTYEGKTTTFNVTVTAAPSSDITYTATQSGGTDGVTDSTGIIFTFSESIDSLNLTAADITVGGTAVKDTAALTGSGTSWSLPVTVSAAGQATVEITKTGIEAGIKNVTVYKARQITPTLTGITAVYTGTATVYPSTPLDNLKTDLTVTAAYSNGTTQTVTDYALSGTLAVGTSTVTVNYEDKTTTFDITVTAAPINDITYTVIQTGGISDAATTTGIVFTFSESIDSLNLTAADITVGGTAAKDTAALTGSGTSWSLPVTVSAAGQATVEITKTGIEAGIKNVTVYKARQITPTLTGITAVYTGTATVYPSTPLDNLKTDLTVTAAYSNGTTQTVTDYALSGTLSVGASVVTVTYEGKTTTFNVTVTATPSSDITYTVIQTGGISDAATTTGIVFTFASSIDGMGISVTDITIGGTAEKGAAIFNGSGASWTLSPITVNSVGTATIKITKIGIEAGTKNVIVYKMPETFEFELNDEGTAYRVSKSPTTNGAVNIPASYNGLPVKFISNYAFSGCTGITSVIIPTGVTSIGEEAFKGCTNLGSITIPNTVTSIGRAAFYECTNLTTITLPNNITSIGSIDDDDGVFEKCTSLTEVIIPNSVTVIGVAAFGNCTNLTNITIPDSVKTIGDFAFYSCTGIASITIPAGVTSVGELVFYEWISSQTIYVRGRASQSAADTTWGSDWRDVCDAVIKYWNGSSYQ